MKRESKVLSVITVVMSSLVISACTSSPSTECGSNESIDLVKQIAKTNAVYEKDFLDFETEEMKSLEQDLSKAISECISIHTICMQGKDYLYAYVAKGYDPSTDPHASANVPNHQKIVSAYNKYKESIEPLQTEITRVANDHKELVVGKIIYDLTDIITTGKNKELNSATCKATLSGKIDGIGSVKNNITFKLETTSDKKLSATVNF